MEVTRELRLERLSKKKGTAPIRLIFCWDSLRLRLASGEVCRPADWHEKGRVKDKPGNYAGDINAVLDRWEKAAVQAHQEARRDGERWDVDRMEAEIKVRYLRLQAESKGKDPIDVPSAAVVAARKIHLLEHMDRWLAHQQGKISLRTGRQLSTEYIKRLRRMRDELAVFEKQYRYPLTFEAMNAEFYAKYQDFHLRALGNKPNTFSGYVKNIKNFLYWAEEHDLPVTPKFHHFETPEVYVGVDSLTQEELLALAAVDFTAPAVQQYLVAQFPERSWIGRGRVPLPAAEHHRRVEFTRDKMLQCCYFGLRIGDADRLAPHHLSGDLVRINANKTGGVCLIPFFDDDVFKPVALIEKYRSLGLPTCLPPSADMLEDYMPHVAKLAGISRIHLTSRIGRKTFATLKIYQGVPKSQVMLATGHTTEASFNRYLGINEEELISIYRRTARRL